MELNTNYYTGEYTLVAGDNGIKRTNTFYQLGQDGILDPNAYIDDSLWLFACYNDPLSVGMFLHGEKYGETSDPDFRTKWRLTPHTFRPTLNHYTVTWSNQAATGSPMSSWSAFAGGVPRIGNNATLANLPFVAPISAIATKYCILYIECYVKTISAIEPIGALNIHDENHILDTDYIYSFSRGTWVAYHTFLENVNNNTVTMGNAVGDVVVTAMRATFYSGTATNRSSARGGFIRLGFDYGGTAINNPYWGEHNVDYLRANNDIYISRNTIGGSGSTMQQGGEFSISVRNSEEYSNGRNSAETAFGFQCNPSFWRIMSTSVASNGLTLGFTFAIQDKLSLQSAFAAYRATGFYFTGTLSTAENGDLNHPDTCPDLHRGVVDENGGVHTQTDGHDDPDPPGLTNDPDKMHSATGYNGDDNIDPSNYSDETPIAAPSLTPVDVFNRTYAMTYTDLRILADELWNTDESVFQEIVDGLKLFGENPMNGLIDVRLYPFNVLSIANSQGSANITVGRTTLNAMGVKIGNKIDAIINLGSCDFFAKNKSFLDYSPYTDARLYIPYCGVVPIDTAEFMGHTITAKMIVDILTGACNVFIYKDGIIAITASGSVGVQIPMSGTDSATYAGNIINTIVNGVTNAVGSGSMAGAAVDLLETAADAQSQVHSTQYAQSGVPTPSCSNWLPQYAYFIIDRPIPNAPRGYGHSVGFACEEYKTLNSYSGYVEVTNPDLSGIGGTDAEKEMIKQLLQGGVYV